MRPVFADPKTDIIFKKIFGEKAHKGLLIDLLNALLELDAAHRVVDIEYLTPEQQPLRKTLKLSMLDLKCTDAQGTRYVVEMQVIEVDGFQKRIVYNACKAYSTQLGVGDDYPQLNDVIAVTICDFILWPDRDDAGWQVPMLSRWHMQEQHRGKRGLPEVQFVFLELPKYEGAERPRTVVEKWAYLFKAAPGLRKVPEPLAEGSFARALEVARTTNLSEEEWTEYEREKMAEQDYRGGIALAEKRAEERGRRQGLVEARAALTDLCEVLGIELTAERRAHLDRLDLAGLAALRAQIKEHRTWPGTPWTTTQ